MTRQERQAFGGKMNHKYKNNKQMMSVLDNIGFLSNIHKS